MGGRGADGIGDRLCTVWVVQHVGTSTATISCLLNSGLAQLSTSSRSLKAVYSTHVVPRAGFQVVVQYTRRPQVCHPTSLTFTSPLVGCVRRWGPRTQPIGWVVNMARVRGHGRGSPDLQPLWWVVNMHSGPHPHLGGPASLTTSRWGRGWEVVTVHKSPLSRPRAQDSGSHAYPVIHHRHHLLLSRHALPTSPTPPHPLGTPPHPQRSLCPPPHPDISTVTHALLDRRSHPYMSIVTSLHFHHIPTVPSYVFESSVHIISWLRARARMSPSSVVHQDESFSSHSTVCLVWPKASVRRAAPLRPLHFHGRTHSASPQANFIVFRAGRSLVRARRRARRGRGDTFD
jgi:hypothetical protein